MNMLYGMRLANDIAHGDINSIGQAFSFVLSMNIG